MASNTHLYVAFAEKVKDNLALLSPTDRVLLVGDFNTSKLEWNAGSEGILVLSIDTGCANALEVLNLISYGNFKQFNGIKNENHKTLDLVFSSDPHS